MRLNRHLSAIALAASVIALMPPQAAEAHAGDVHIGGTATGMSLPALLGACGIVALMVAFFVFNWVRYRREQAREAGSSAPLPPGETGEIGPDSDGRPREGER